MGSRLSRRVQRKSKNQLYIFLGATIVFLMFIYFTGPITLSLFGNLFQKKDTVSQIKSQISPPILDTIPTATPSSTITISGRVLYEEGEVQIYTNNSLTNTIQLNGKADFSEEVKLSDGDNFIKARYSSAKGESSEFTDEEKIIYIKDAPKLEISSPKDGATFNKSDQEIEIKGETNPENIVTINGFRSIVESNGSFSYRMKLTDGENKIEIISQNLVDSKTTKNITVSYSP